MPEIKSPCVQIDLRRGVRLVCVQDGIATFSAANEFEVKVTLTQIPINLQEALSKNKAQAAGSGISDNSSSALEEIERDNAVESDPSFLLNAMETDFETSTTLDRLRWWSLTELTFYPSALINCIQNSIPHSRVLLENPDGSPFLEHFQVEYMRRELDMRMINLASDIFSKQLKQGEDKNGEQESMTVEDRANMDSDAIHQPHKVCHLSTIA